MGELTPGERAGPDGMSLGKLALPLSLGGGPNGPDQPAHLPPRSTLTAAPIYDLLASTKELVLWNDNHRISMTQAKNRITEKNSNDGPMMMVYQTQEVMKQTNGSLQ